MKQRNKTKTAFMKRVHFFLLSLLSLVCFSCGGDSDNEPIPALELSTSAFSQISSNGETLEVTVQSSYNWTVSLPNNVKWCTLSQKSGTGNGKFNLYIEANLNEKTRSSSVTVSANGTNKSIQLTQNAATVTTEDYHYELPVIFHVLYKDASDVTQYVPQSRLAEILEGVNKLYQDKLQSTDMNLTFKLATTDEVGNTLMTPGVEYIKWNESYPINCDLIMSESTGKYTSLIWNPNQYINVMLYHFTDNNILGISHLPFSTAGTYLEGLQQINYTYLEKQNLGNMYSSSINSKYINEKSTAFYRNPNDATENLAHELGHYLGLHHVFAEDENGYADNCNDTDYCQDTPSYNRNKYNVWYLIQRQAGVTSFDKLAQRTNDETGYEFVSTNIMDYFISYSNQFTADQRARIRHVLMYSPLIPGPKKTRDVRSAAPEGTLDLPFRTVKCAH